MYDYDNCKIEAIFYVPIGINLQPQDIVMRNPDINTFPEGGKKRFIDYFIELAKSRRRSEDEYTAYLVDKKHNNYRQDIYENLLTYDLKKEKREYKETCSKFANICQQLLITTAKDGILFICRISVTTTKTNRYLCILKLDPSEDGVLYVAENLVKYNSFEEVLPGPKDLQKGAVYPHPQPIDNGIKISQKDGHADYFLNFLGAYRAIPTQNTVRFLMKAVNRVRHKPIDIDETKRLFSLLNDKAPSGAVILNRQELGFVLAETLDAENPNVVKNKVTEYARSQDIIHGEITASALSNMKMKIRIGDIIVVGTLKSIAERLTHDKVGEEHRIIIEGPSVRVDAGLK